MASRIVSSASSLDRRSGAKPPSSPTDVARPFFLRRPFRVWNTSTPMRRASAKVGAPWGTIMNSWGSSALSAWAPPLMMFMKGTGSVRARAAVELDLHLDGGVAPAVQDLARENGFDGGAHALLTCELRVDVALLAGGHDDASPVGHGVTAAIFRGIVADDCARGHLDLAVQDRLLDLRVPVDGGVVHEDGILDVAVRVHAHP